MVVRTSMEKKPSNRMVAVASSAGADYGRQGSSTNREDTAARAVLHSQFPHKRPATESIENSHCWDL